MAEVLQIVLIVKGATFLFYQIIDMNITYSDLLDTGSIKE